MERTTQPGTPASETAGAEPIRLILVLPGAAALGTFEAGAVFEVLRAIRRGAPITVDILAGASAGSLVGAIATKSLVSGVPFEHVYSRWGDYTLRHLTRGYEAPEEALRNAKMMDRGILSSRAVRQILEENLVADPVERNFQPAHPAPRLCLSMTVTNLDGLPAREGQKPGNRFGESITFRFSPPNPHRLAESSYPPAVWERVGRVAQASASFPGVFDPLSIPWHDRIWIPGSLEETWENHELLERLHQNDPGIQSKMLYSDGGILDNQPVERAIANLPLVTGGEGEPGLETLVYNPRRFVLIAEPEPTSTNPAEIRSGNRRTWYDILNRSVNLWASASSPSLGQRRVDTINVRLNRLFRFLAELALQMRTERHMPAADEAMERFIRRNPELDVLRRASSTLVQQEDPPGLLDSELFSQAVRRFYKYLTSGRFDQDMQWLRQLPAGRVRQANEAVLGTLSDLREAYQGLWNLDSRAPGAHQELLEEIHVNLAISLGLTQPWVGLCEITPEDPRMLQGDQLYNFGGFFSSEFLRHDYAVGRWYAHLWLQELIPEYVVEDPPAQPPLPEGGLSWRHLWSNRQPIWWMVGRLAAVMLEAAGLNYAGGGQLVVKLLGWSLLLAVLHGFVLLASAWFGWITFPAEFQRFRFWLMIGTSLFPLTLGFLLGIAVRRRG